MEKVPVATLTAEMVALFAGFALLLFLPAGTFAWGPGWVFLAIFFSGGVAITLWLLRANPGLLNERLTGLGKANQQAWDKRLMTVIMLLYIVWIVVMPLDAVRFRWSHVPCWVQVVGGVLFGISWYMLFLTYRENSFLSPAARIQRERGQTVISTGPYRYVRHPMYAGVLVQTIGIALLLGSWVGLAVGMVLMLLVARRAVLEERMLRDELPGYTDYMMHVKYRMIPRVW